MNGYMGSYVVLVHVDWPFVEAAVSRTLSSTSLSWPPSEANGLWLIISIFRNKSEQLACDFLQLLVLVLAWFFGLIGEIRSRQPKDEFLAQEPNSTTATNEAHGNTTNSRALRTCLDASRAL